LTILGLRAADGTNGAPVNLPDAVKFLTQAAEKGQAVAQYRLGTLYERGQGVAADGAKAVHWYGLAAAQGNRKAMHNLAVAHASGSGSKKNMPEAARWFAKAASFGLSDSQFNLAVLYERGDGVPQSLVDAYKWYSIAAATGDAESKARMGVLQTQLGDGRRLSRGAAEPRRQRAARARRSRQLILTHISVRFFALTQWARTRMVVAMLRRRAA
jgi:localization factor PodJL